jgi:hypothetical protein
MVALHAGRVVTNATSPSYRQRNYPTMNDVVLVLEDATAGESSSTINANHEASRNHELR